MYMIEISESKVGKMADYAEKMLRYGGKLMQCIDELEGNEFGERGGSRGGSYGNRYNEADGGMGMRYGERGSYGNRGGSMNYRDEDEWDDEEMGERRGRRRRDSRGRYM